MHTRTALLALLAASTLGLAACSNPSDGPSASTGSGSSSGSGSSAPATAVPVADVVSAVKTDSSLHDALPASIRTSGVLTFGTTLNPGTSSLPYSGSVDGKNVGLHLDLANAIGKVLGVRVDLQNGTFPTIVPGVQNGKYDVGLDNFGVTKKRLQVVDYATYLNDGQSFLASSSVKLDKATSVTDLCGLIIATSPGSTFQQLLTNGASSCAKAGKKPYTVQYYSTSAPVLLGLANGKIDVEFGPTLGVKYDAAHIPNTKFLGQVSTTPVGLITAKGSPLAPLLQKAINALIASGDYGKIVAKWSVQSDAVTTSQFNPTPSF